VNEGKILTGADDGCLRCMDLVNYWSPPKNTQMAVLVLSRQMMSSCHLMTLDLATFPKQDNIEAYENAALNAASAISVIDAAVDVAVSASDAIADEIQFNNGIPNSLNEDLSETSWNPDLKTTISEDSEEILMSHYYNTHGKFLAGADSGCLRCIEFANKGKSEKKHSNVCAAKTYHVDQLHECHKDVALCVILQKMYCIISRYIIRRS
jgi:hypothetical protein